MDAVNAPVLGSASACGSDRSTDEHGARVGRAHIQPRSQGRGFQMVYDKDILSMMELVKGDAQEEKEQGAGVGRKRAAVEMEGKEFIKTEDDVAGRTES